MNNEQENIDSSAKKQIGRKLETDLDKANDISNDLQNFRKHLKGFSDDFIDTSKKVTELSRKGKSALAAFGTGVVISLSVFNPAESIVAKTAALSTALSALAALVVPESEKEKLKALVKEAEEITLKLEELSSNNTVQEGVERDRLYNHYDSRLTMIEEQMSLINSSSYSRQAIGNIRKMRKIKEIIPEEQFNEKTNRLLNPSSNSARMDNIDISSNKNSPEEVDKPESQP